jgi:hypothetical protein
LVDNDLKKVYKVYDSNFREKRSYKQRQMKKEGIEIWGAKIPQKSLDESS